jgi:hypothetical protein
MPFSQLCKNTSTYLCRHPNISIVRHELINGVSIVIAPFFDLRCIIGNLNPWIVQDWGSKSAHVGLTMTMLVKVWVPYLVNTMLIRQWEELNMVKESVSNYFHPTWKLAFRTMVTKMTRTTSWIFVCSLPWVQCMKWIPIGSMGCVHTHQMKPTIKGCDTPNHIENIVEKTNEGNWKVWKIGWIISQMPTPRPKHGKI